MWAEALLKIHPVEVVKAGLDAAVQEAALVARRLRSMRSGVACPY